jgi:hypothetical protein
LFSAIVFCSDSKGGIRGQPNILLSPVKSYGLPFQGAGIARKASKKRRLRHLLSQKNWIFGSKNLYF